MFEKEYTLYDILIAILDKLSINEITIWIGIILFLVLVSLYMNITLLQLFLICGVLFLILYMVQLKQNETDELQEKINLTETNNMSLLKFVNSVSYFKLYNPAVYSNFMYKIKKYINLLKFADIHEQNKYKLYPKKIIKENLDFQKQDIIETFSSFEHTLDDRITSAYKLRELTDQLNTILIKSNLII
jgi:hypothetical protein